MEHRFRPARFPLCLAILLAIPMGVYTALHRQTWGARLLLTVSLVGVSLPTFIIGIMLILGVLSLVIGLTIDPFWLVMGSPAILTLVVYIGVRLTIRRRTGE